MNIEKREVGVDILKICAAIGILTCHIFNWGYDTSITSWRFVYYTCSFAVPMFFFINGYLFFRKNEINLQYIERKVWNIFTFILKWWLALSIVEYIIKGEVDFSTLFTLLSGQSYVGVFWFLACLALILIIFAYPAYRLYTWNRALYLKCICVITLIVVLFRVYLFWAVYHPNAFTTFMNYTLPQWLYLYMYGTLWMFAPVLYKLKEWKWYKFTKNIYCVAFLSVLNLAYILGKLMLMQHIGNLSPINFYMTPIWLLVLVTNFCCILNIEIYEEKIVKFITFASKSSVVVYAIQIPILFEVRELFFDRYNC